MSLLQILRPYMLWQEEGAWNCILIPCISSNALDMRVYPVSLPLNRCKRPLQNQTENAHRSPTSNQIRHILLHLLSFRNRIIILPNTWQRHLRLVLPERTNMLSCHFQQRRTAELDQ